MILKMKTAKVLPFLLLLGITCFLFACQNTAPQEEQPKSPAGVPADVPNSPNALTATVVSTDQIDLQWHDNADNEQGFRVERAVGGGSFTEVAVLNANVESYGDTGLAAETTYTYRVSAYNNEGNSRFSNVVDATTPASPVDNPPSDLSAIAVSWKAIRLSWRDNSTNEDGFRIERATTGQSFSQIAEVNAGVTSHDDTGRSPSTAYHYRVRAFNSVGNSDYSDEATAVTDDMPVNTGQIIVDHTAVDRYDDIPQYYIDEVKKMYLNIPGESHSSGYRIGLALLMALDSRFQVIRTESSPPAPYTTVALRVDRLVRNQYNNWSAGAGEREWYTWHAWDPTDPDYPAASAVKIKNHITYSNTNNLEIAAIGFGWCWDFTWHNPPDGDEDPVYHVHWAGSSVGGPDGDLRWGLDDEDTILTGNRVNLDDYLAATQEYIDYVNANGFNTVVFFTTGPVDGNAANEAGYQREVKHQYIRDYVLQDSTRVLFDYADILCWNDANEQNTGAWNGHTYPQIHPDNRLDYDEAWNMITAVEDGDHIGEVGAFRLGKALWWMLARIAGWDGN